MELSDNLIKMVQAPDKFREGLTIEELRLCYENQIRDPIEQQLKFYESKYQGFQARFTYFENQNRKVTMWTEFSVLFLRNILYLRRNPRTIQAVIFNACFFAFIYANLFFGLTVIDPTS